MYTLTVDEPFRDSLGRIMTELMDENLAYLDDISTDPILNVHNIRKNIKRSRALLRLGRYSIRRDRYSTENFAFRDIGRLLSGVRDLAVLLETIEMVIPTSETQSVLEQELIEELKFSLGAEIKQAYQSLQKNKPLVDVLRSGFESRRSAWVDSSFDYKPGKIAEGYWTTYRNGRRRMKLIFTPFPSPEALHEWRKQVKYLLYHHELLMLLLSKQDVFLEKTFALDHLADLLGKAHDAYVLRIWLSKHPLGDTLTPIIRRVEYARLDNEGAARSHGELVYSDNKRTLRSSLAGFDVAMAGLE